MLLYCNSIEILDFVIGYMFIFVLVKFIDFFFFLVCFVLVEMVLCAQGT